MGEDLQETGYQTGIHDAQALHSQQHPDVYLNSVGPLLWYVVPSALTFVFAKRMFANPKNGNLMDIFSPISSRNFRVEVRKTKFSDVIGIDEAKEEVMQYFQFLKANNRFQQIGARMPKGCLLTGEPGTGKTLLAKAIAGEANVPFFSCNGADFVEVYGGSGARRVRELFQQAREEMPSVIFIDEIDALGSRQTTQNSGGSGEENRTMNQLLAELDGVAQSPTDRILVFAATNIKSSLDPALLREGRFDRKVQIDLPDLTARVDLFRFYLGKHMQETRGKDFTENCQKLASLTPGISPATISTIVNEASLKSSVNREPTIKYETLLHAIEDIIIGKKREVATQSKESMMRAAYYEAGKAIVSWFLPLEAQRQGEIIKLSINNRGDKQGYNFRKGKEAHEYDTDVKLFNEICQLVAGKIAEKSMFGSTVTKTSINDMNHASRLCLQGLLSFGFHKELGRLSNKHDEIGEGQIFLSLSSTRQEKSEQRANVVLSHAVKCSTEILTQHSKNLDAVVSELLQKKELDSSDLTRLLGERR
ncbi:ATP-dependent zinc metallopeptidase [Perkinsela sp. CCAP 1560/4]|nr:ATP-dependent zinc metallopeptidase [Perkinsela sp. CCAP 1560/4]|eukprot:KNH09491.1 ATP-dependent zinc metallopeptidase [Perkinsela sp. CCAP 1560/4]